MNKIIRSTPADFKSRRQLKKKYKNFWNKLDTWSGISINNQKYSSLLKQYNTAELLSDFYFEYYAHHHTPYGLGYDILQISNGLGYDILQIPIKLWLENKIKLKDRDRLIEMLKSPDKENVYLAFLIIFPLIPKKYFK